MNHARIFSSAILIALCSTTAAGQATPSSQLVVAEKNGVYELAVGVSRLVVTIPKNALVVSSKTGSSNGSRYFSFEDPGTSLMVSGWFEPATSFKGMESFWAGEQRSMTQNGMQLQNVTTEIVGNWQVMWYDVQLPVGRNANVRAELVRAGTWMDVHMSITSARSDAENRKALRDVLETIRVDERVP